MSATAGTLPRAPRGAAARAAGRARSLARSRPGDPRWVRPALLGVLALAAVLVLWDLSRNGYSNDYYAAAAKAGSESWKAWFFGALDPGSFITVDKPPLSLWLMGLSARVFGFSSFAILAPQALCTVGAVALLYATVRRPFGPAAGIAAAAALALTPVTVAIGRVNNPDALLVLLTVASAYLLVRALESGRTKHLVWCGVFVGLAFMTKMLEGWMIVPALAAAYLLAGPPKLFTRLRQLVVAGVAMVAVSAAWPLAVTLWPGAKPYIGGSTDGSVWNLIFGYNGFGRITGDEMGGGGGGGGGPTFGGASGLLRMFNAEVGGQVAWLLPLAGVSLVAGLWLTRRAARTDRRRAAWVLFGLWALTDIAVFSSQKGIFHPYYVSALAPAVAGLAGAGVVTLWTWARHSIAGLVVLDATIAGTAWLAVDLLERTPDFAPWLRALIPAAAAVAVAASVLTRLGGRTPRAVLAAAAVAGAVALAAGPASYSVASAGRSLDGNNVLAGPADVGSGGFGGGFGGGGAPGRGGFAGGPPSGAAGSGAAAGGFAGGPSSGAAVSGAAAGRFAGGPSSGAAGNGGGFTRGGGFGGGGQVSGAEIKYLEAHQGAAKYLVAATGSQTTAPIIIESGKAVVTIGGFSGSDNAPTLAQFIQMVRSGQLKYVVVGGGMGGGPGGRAGNSDIASWVQQHGKAVSGYSDLYAVSA